ncbi:hypothetical protein [Methanolapillus ohkumae]|uniref:hypothetical protein n=1 Tax=Methanolapillus ohkumae TaxID=3028298 RepID=UPI0030B8F03D
MTKEWNDNLQKNDFETIWLSEIADKSNNLSLVVGRIHFDVFMKFDYLPAAEEREMVHLQSFARARRIVETCRKFWKEIGEEIKSICQAENDRILLHPINNTLKLNLYNTYELQIDNINIEVLWTENGFVIIENLEALEKRLQTIKKEFKDLKINQIIEGQVFQIFEPGQYKKNKEPKGVFSDFKIEKLSSYFQISEILSEPKTFMMLIPADKTMIIIEKIKEKYEKEMGKVSQRLPISLGVVFANKFTPLRSVLDAGKRMLDRPAPLVKADVMVDIKPDEGKWISKFKSDKFVSNEINGLLNEEIKIKEMNRILNFNFEYPVSFEDGQEDVFYPYFLTCPDWITEKA